MSSAEGLLFVLIFLLVAAAWVGIVVVIPSCARSHFRYRLWEIRDDIVDDMLEGRLPEDDRSRSLLCEVEIFIQHAKDFTATNVLLASIAGKDADLRSSDVTRSPTVPDESTQRLYDYYSDLHVAQLKYLLIGSMAGWILVIGMIVLAPIIALIHRRSHDQADLAASSSVKERFERKFGLGIAFRRNLIMR